MLSRGSCLSLIGFCAALVLIAALALALLFAGATVAVAVAQSARSSGNAAAVKAEVTPSMDQEEGSRAEGTFAGVITDSDCGARHAGDSGKSPAECTRACVRRGSKYILVNGEKSYVLQGNPAIIDQLAGQRGRIVGTLDGNTITISSIATQ